MKRKKRYQALLLAILMILQTFAGGMDSFAVESGTVTDEWVDEAAINETDDNEDESGSGGSDVFDSTDITNGTDDAGIVSGDGADGTDELVSADQSAANQNTEESPEVTYTLVFNAGEGKFLPDNTNIYSITDIDPDGVVVPIPEIEPVREGYRFMGWIDADYDNNGIIYRYSADIGDDDIANNAYAVLQNTELNAKWERLWSVTYVLNHPDDDYDEVITDDNKYIEGEEITLKTPSELIKNNYAFTGWKTGSGSKVLAGGDTCPMAPVVDSDTDTGGITFTGEWRSIEIDVSFDANGADGELPEPLVVYWGQTITLPPCPANLQKEGYYFIGWCEKDDASGTIYGPDTVYPEIKIYDDTVFVAQWAANPTVRYHANGGKGRLPSINPQAFTPGSPISVFGNDGELSRKGYVFAGWTLNPEGRGNVYGAKSITGLPEDISAGIAETYLMTRSNVTFYARWLRQVNISFDLMGGEGDLPYVDNPYLESSKYTFTGQSTPTKDNYTFAGWYADGDYGTLYGPGMTNDAYIIPNKDVTLFAKWIPTDVTFPQFEFTGLNPSASQICVADETTTLNCTVSSSAEKYTIIWQRSADSGRNWSNISNSAKTIVTSTADSNTNISYTTPALKSADHNNLYRIKVTAEIQNGEGLPVSFEDYSPYAVITVVDVYPNIVNETPYQNRITWTGAEADNITYSVCSRAANEKKWWSSSPISETEFEDSFLLPNTVYYYKVAVLVEGKEIGTSRESSMKTATVTAPTKQKLIKTTPTTMEIKWNTVNSAKQYLLSVTDMDTAGKPEHTVIIDALNGTEQTEKLIGLSPNHNYQVKIAAVWDGNGILSDEEDEDINIGPWSGVVKGKTSGPAPAKPALNGKAVGTTASITIKALTPNEYKDNDEIYGYCIMQDKVPVDDPDLVNGFISIKEFKDGIFEYTAQNLIPGRKSSFTVAACWSDGIDEAESKADDSDINYRMGKPSSALNVTPDGMPAPSSLKAKDISMMGFTIVCNGNNSIMEYNVYVDGELYDVIDVSDKETYIDGMPSTTYNVEVAGVYEKDDDGETEGKRKAIKVKTPGGAAPTGFRKIGSVADGELTLEWKRIKADLAQEKEDYEPPEDGLEVMGYVISKTVGNNTVRITDDFEHPLKPYYDKEENYWDEVDDTTRYRYTDSGLLPGMTVTYTVQACYGDSYDGDLLLGSRSSTVKVTVPNPVPSGLGGWSDETSITATWKGVGTDSYSVYLYDAKGNLIDQEAGDDFEGYWSGKYEYTFDSLIPNTQYQFKVAAIWETDDDLIIGKLSSAKKLKTTNSAPKKLIKKDVTATTITLQWTGIKRYADIYGDAYDNVTGYRINRNGEFLTYVDMDYIIETKEYWKITRYWDYDYEEWEEDEVLISEEDIYEFTDDEVVPGMTYTYTVQACWGELDDEGGSDLSGPATSPCKVKTMGNIPAWKSLTAAPTAITAEWKSVKGFTGNTSTDKITGNVTGYNVYLYDAGGHRIDAAIGVKELKYTFSELDPNTQYQFKVEAIWEIATTPKPDPDDSSDDPPEPEITEATGGLSGAKAGMTTGPAPGKPAAVDKLTNTSTEVKLKWSLPSGMDSNKNDLKGFLITRTIGTDTKYIFVDMKDYKSFYDDPNINGWIDYEVAPNTKVSYTIQACWSDNSKGIAFCRPGKKTSTLTVSIPK